MSTSTITLEDEINFDTNRYERVALVDVQPGDAVRIPTLIIDGEVASWSVRAYTVESVEEKAPGVFFVWRPADEFPPTTTCDRFMMMCGPSARAGVLRVKRVTLVDDNDKIWATTKSNPELSHAFDSEHRALCRTTIRPGSPFRTTLAMARDMVKLHEQCARKLFAMGAV
jgi:hypothetical protein